MQICLLSTGQILQSGLRVEGNKSGFTFCDKSGNTVLLATPNLWGNIQIIRTHILKHDDPNPISLITRHLDFETLHHHFGHTSDKVMFLTMLKIQRRSISQHRNMSAVVVLLERYPNTVSLKTLLTLVSL